MLCSDVAGHQLESFGVGGGEGNTAAFLGHDFCDRFANAARSAGNQDSTALEV